MSWIRTSLIGLLLLMPFTAFADNTKSLNLVAASSQYATADNFADNLANFGVEAWFKTSSGAEQKLVTKITGTGAGQGWALYITGSELYCLVQMSGGSIYKLYGGVAGLLDGAWHYVNCTYVLSTNTMTMSVDGVAKSDAGSAGTVTTYTNANSVVVGQDSNHTAGAYFNGQLDDVRVWQTSTIASTNYTAPCGVSTSATNLLAWYQFENTLTNSASGGGHDMTGTNTPTYSASVPYTCAAAGVPTFISQIISLFGTW